MPAPVTLDDSTHSVASGGLVDEDEDRSRIEESGGGLTANQEDFEVEKITSEKEIQVCSLDFNPSMYLTVFSTGHCQIPGQMEGL